MTASVPAAASLPATLDVPRGSWIQSAAYDLSLFVMAPVLILPLVVGMATGAPRLALVGFVLAFAHYLSTFAFFFWDENQEYHRARWLAFFGGPVVIGLAFFLLVWLRSPLMQLALLAWNTYHVSRQSCGLLSLYRHRAGVSDPAQKELANHAIIATNAWFVLWNLETHNEVFPLLSGLAAALPAILFGAFGVLALLGLVRLVRGLRARAAAGQAPGLPELAMLGMSLAFFHPYLWLPSSEGATFVMLLPHYVQYLGLVWLLHRRKFPQPAGSRGQRVLHRLGSRLPLLLGALALGGLSFLAAKVVLTRAGHVAVFESAYLLLAFVHFYLDGLFWAFRDPHVRRSLGPALLLGTPAPAAAR
jgi:hypothetical protein